MTMVKADLRAEAGAEARRLAWARAFTSERDEEALGHLEGDRPWAVSARGWRTRGALGSRVALIYRVAFEDASGATVEARLIAIAIDLTAARQRRLTYRTIEQLVRQLEPRLQSEIAVASADWRREVEERLLSCASARIARGSAIAAQGANVQRREYQPGLFDRRAERARDRASEESGRADAAAAHQLAEASLPAIAQRPPQLLLVLTP